MPKAEAGSSKWLSNKMKSKGLTRLRWYCQVCEKPCREENAFKQHCLSESHVRRMQLVGENSKGVIEDYSRQFNNDFLRLLRTAHGDKKVHMNRFYQEYIANRDHIHMNSTKWSSLTEYAKYLGREGICRVEEDEKGLYISWIDNSPEALRRQEALRRKEAQDKGDEEREQQMIREQIQRAQRDAVARGAIAEDEDEKDRTLKREEGQKITLNFGSKPAAATPSTNTEPAKTKTSSPDLKDGVTESQTEQPVSIEKEVPAASDESKPLSLKVATKPQPKNVFKQAKKAFGSKEKGTSKKAEEPKKMSEMERIMREEMERKRVRENSGFGGPNKKQRKF